MLSALLRSGDIKDYTALGQDGMAVYTVASQLRDAIKFKRGKTFADYLAIPQRNDQGSKIDWYVPFDSNRADGQYLIIPWTSASLEEKEAALAELRVFERSILELGKELATSGAKGDQLLFARLLCGGNANNLEDAENLKALRFPNPEHVYLVNDRPVITFWGFSEKNAKIYGSPFLQLTPSPVSNKSTQSVSTITHDVPKSSGLVDADAKDSRRGKHLCCILPLLLGLLALLAWLLRGFWLPLLGFNVGTELPQLDKTIQTTESINLPKNCELRIVDGVPYQYGQGAWMDNSGHVVQDTSLIQRINQAPTDKILDCKNVHYDNLELPNNKVSSIDLIPAERIDGGNDSKLVDSSAMSSVDDNLSQGDTKNQPQDSSINDNGQMPVPELEQKADETVQNPENKSDNTQLDNEQSNDQQSDKPVQTIPPVDPDLNSKENQGGEYTDKLQIPRDSLENGNTDFLNGNWKAGAGIQDKKTGKPLRLNYSFSDGVGQVKVERGDGIQCVGDVAAKMQSSGLNITNNGVAQCSDGSTYQLPMVTCKAGATSSADCQGSYGSGQKFPISMKSN